MFGRFLIVVFRILNIKSMDTSSSSTEAAATAPLTTIRNVDLKRYMGRWYEIANVPTRFQPQDSTNTTATYSLQDDGETVNVVNSTFLKAEDKDGNAKLGGSAGIKGIAYKKDVKEEDAKFKGMKTSNQCIEST